MILSDFDQLRNHPMIRFKVEEVNGVPIGIISYMISDKELWENDLALEARGIAFDVLTGQCICLPLNKFFNVGESTDTQTDLIKDQFVECFEKRDGSMVTPVLVNGKLFWKTKKSFFSDVAVLAQSMVPDNVTELAWYCQLFKLTPIFEFTHPDSRIVLDYSGEPNFTLIAIRDTVNGKYLSWEKVESIAKLHENVPTVKKYEKTWSEILDDVDNKKDIEGYVLVLKDGRRVKIKTKWYLDMHHTMTDLRERDAVEAILNETIDDMKSLLSSQGMDLTVIEELESLVATEIASIREEVNAIIMSCSNKSIKEVAIEMKGHPLFSLIMSEKRGKEADYSTYWKRNRLQDFSLRCIFNKGFSS